MSEYSSSQSKPERADAKRDIDVVEHVDHDVAASTKTGTSTAPLGPKSRLR